MRQTSALARRFGEEPIAQMSFPRRTVRPLLEVALENAVQGCVRETYSALECVWQARFAGDPIVRATMKLIAHDELRHLALSWAVDEPHVWLVRAGGLPQSFQSLALVEAIEAKIAA